ncbi:MAG: plastocyanin/azurin family copper-binding protein [Nitrosopumilaceae archaeon]
MRLEIWIIGVMIFLVAGVLGLIAASPDDVSVPKSTHVVEVSEKVSMKEPSTLMPVPAPGFEDVPEMIVKEPGAEEFDVELEESISVEELEAVPEPMEAKEPSLPDIVEVNVAEGSGVPGCDETNECYIPYEVSISVGGEVIWNNGDSAAHTVTSGNPTDGPDGEFDSSLFMSGTTFSYTFDEAGEYEYFCMVHPWMKGIVQVS